MAKSKWKQMHEKRMKNLEEAEAMSTGGISPSDRSAMNASAFNTRMTYKAVTEAIPAMQKAVADAKAVHGKAWKSELAKLGTKDIGNIQEMATGNTLKKKWEQGKSKPRKSTPKIPMRYKY